jgi:hypothetical protein
MIEHRITEAINQGNFEHLISSLPALASEGWIDQYAEHLAIKRGLERAVDALLDRGLVSEEQENRLALLAGKLGFTQAELNDNPSFHRLVKNPVLRDISEGKIPKRYNLQGGTLFNLQKNEVLIWAFSGVKYCEDKIHRSYVGGSDGISVRVAKGVYYHTSAFRGHQIQTHGVEQIESGALGVTTKGLYLVGPVKSFRIPFAKIVNFVPYSDGFGIFRDAANARQQVFVTGDGWFSYNLVTNLSQLHLEPEKSLRKT